MPVKSNLRHDEGWTQKLYSLSSSLLHTLLTQYIDIEKRPITVEISDPAESGETSTPFIMQKTQVGKDVLNISPVSG